MFTAGQDRQESYRPYWGKARQQVTGPDCHLLIYHSLDVAAVGSVYLRHQPVLVSFFAKHLGCDDQEAVRSWLTFWLALHDLGKFSLSFQGQRADVMTRLQGVPPQSLGLPTVRHDSLGFFFWRERLQHVAMQEQWFGDDPDVIDGLDAWVRAVCGHHGQPPQERGANDGIGHFDTHFRPHDKAATLAAAQTLRTLLLTPQAAAVPTCLGDAEAFAVVSQTLSWWMAGLTVLADWIGSNTDDFPYRDDSNLPLANYWEQALSKADQALQRSGVLPTGRRPEQTFGDLFEQIAEPSPLQRWASTVDVPDCPQLHILEDVTGAGKTEAAMMLTHRLMARGAADGFFIGLPTMATANAMYGRIATLYDRLFPELPSLVLAHGHKNLVEAFAASVVRPGRAEGDAQQLDESATQRCTQWLADHNKRALLAPAGVGTLDQGLLGVLQSKHQCLRLLGLFRKVLIVDEVHACDPYMLTTLADLLRFHAAAGGSAILLSATLPEQTKRYLVSAFQKGIAAWNPLSAGQKLPSASLNPAYPLTTSWYSTQPDALPQTPIPTREAVRRHVKVQYVSDDNTVVAHILDSVAQGQCVAWIRNTVGDAMKAYRRLLDHLPAERIILFHARMTLGDRLDVEALVLRTLGRLSSSTERAGRVLIATQVAEQSLDIDVDQLITDLAPIDRLIQRAGRLRRHVRAPSGNVLTSHDAVDERGTPCLWVLGPAWVQDPDAQWVQRAHRPTAHVYQHHGQLWLTAQALQSGGLSMPDDARALIESVFGEDASIPAGLQHNADTSQGKAYAEQSQAMQNAVNLLSGYQQNGTQWAADTVAPSRLGEDTVEVVLAKWVNGTLQPWRDDKPAAHAWAYSTVRLAKRLIASTAAIPDPTQQAELQRLLDEHFQGGRWKVVLPLQLTQEGHYCGMAQRLDRHGQAVNVMWRYSADMGLLQEVSKP